MNFCRRCGTKLTQKSEGILICENKHQIFKDMVPACGIFFIDKDNNVTLSVRGREPFKGMLDAFGGFFDMGETIEQCLAREIEEELGLTPDDYETPQLLGSGVTDYEYDGDTRKVLGLMHWSRLKPGANPVPNDDVADIKTIPLAEIDMDDIGADDVKAGIEKLRQLFLA